MFVCVRACARSCMHICVCVHKECGGQKQALGHEELDLPEVMSREWALGTNSGPLRSSKHSEPPSYRFSFGFEHKIQQFFIKLSPVTA